MIPAHRGRRPLTSCFGTRTARSWIRSLLLPALIGIATIPVFAQQRPFRTDDAELVAVGQIRVGFGVEFLQGEKYSLSGLEGNLTRIGVTNLQVGVGQYAEFQLSGVVQDFLSVSRRYPPVIPPDFTGNATSDFGDLVLATKLRLLQERASKPAMAFKFSVQLPNASNESGLGTDETGFYASLLLSKRFGEAQLLGNVGLAILGSPVRANSQSDLLTYGLGLIVPVNPKISLVGEIHGRQGPDQVGNESRSQVCGGLLIHAAGLRWDIVGITGFRKFDPDAGIAVGITFEFQAFNKKHAPTTVK